MIYVKNIKESLCIPKKWHHGNQWNIIGPFVTFKISSQIYFTGYIFGYIFGLLSPFREQNDTRAVNRTCERLCMLFACMSKPLNWSAITTKYHKNNWTFFKIRYIYTKGRNLTFKIVYSTGLVLKKIPKLKTDTKKPDKTDLPLRAAFGPS